MTERKPSGIYRVPSSDTHNPEHLIQDRACSGGCGLVLPIAVLYGTGRCPRCGEQF